MTNPYITAALADQRTQQLLREASQYRLARAATPSRASRRAMKPALRRAAVAT